MAVGIICEYNPFHNGHLYHLAKVKEVAKGEPIILIISGNFTQRGELCIINKWDKTRIALEYGIDLIVELPFFYATQSADIFAKGAITLLKELKVDKLVFGSESNNINEITELALTQLNNNKYNELLKNNLHKGINYPTAMSLALKQLNNTTITSPNDLLGLSYIKEIIKQKTNIEPITIQRTSDFHNKELTGSIVSASAIRNNLTDPSIKKYVPKETYNYIKNISNIDYFNYLKYKILTEKESINNYLSVDEGIEHKIIKNINKAGSIDDLINLIKSKRYTYNRIQRMLVHILCGFTKEESKNEIKYLRILGFTKKGQEYLNKIKKNVTIPIITNSEKKYLDILSINNRVDAIYNLINNINQDETKMKPLIK